MLTERAATFGVGAGKENRAFEISSSFVLLSCKLSMTTTFIPWSTVL